MRRRWAVLSVAILAGSLLFALFVPIIQVEAKPVGVVYMRTTTTTEVNQTKTLILVYNWPTETSISSLTYCLWGSGALFQNGTYHPFIVSHTLIGGQWCPALKP